MFLQGILLPIFEAIISLLDQVLKVGYDQLTPEQKAQLNGYLPTIYVFLKTKGAEIVARTSNTLDDAGVAEFIAAIEAIADAENLPLPTVPA